MLGKFDHGAWDLRSRTERWNREVPGLWAMVLASAISSLVLLVGLGAGANGN